MIFYSTNTSPEKAHPNQLIKMNLSILPSLLACLVCALIGFVLRFFFAPQMQESTFCEFAIPLLSYDFPTGNKTREFVSLYFLQGKPYVIKHPSPTMLIDEPVCECLIKHIKDNEIPMGSLGTAVFGGFFLLESCSKLHDVENLEECAKDKAEEILLKSEVGCVLSDGEPEIHRKCLRQEVIDHILSEFDRKMEQKNE